MLNRIVGFVFLVAACWSLFEGIQATESGNVPWLRLLTALMLLIVGAYLALKSKR